MPLSCAVVRERIVVETFAFGFVWDIVRHWEVTFNFRSPPASSSPGPPSTSGCPGPGRRYSTRSTRGKKIQNLLSATLKCLLVFLNCLWCPCAIVIQLPYEMKKNYLTFSRGSFTKTPFLIFKTNCLFPYSSKFFFNRLVSLMSSGPLHCHVLCGEGAVERWRGMLGPTKVFKTRYEQPGEGRN